MPHQIAKAGRRPHRQPAGDVSGRSGYEDLYSATADALADRVIERQWSYYAGAGTAIAFAAGILVGALQLVAGEPWHLLLMPVWFLLMGGILWLNAWASNREVSWRLYPQVALVIAMVGWPVLMYVVFTFVV
ncbi:MAG: hypothetical protein KY455_09755 [Euryarchaeota archaeon]|nr:hypothetical protein [Euryarchaeota archaeon]